MTNYASGTYTLLGILGNEVTATVDPSAQVTFNLAGVVDTFAITGAAGANITINNTVAVANNLILNTNGGNIQIGTLAGALGNVTATISGGGSFDVGGAALSVLNTSSIAFGTGGGTLVLGTSGDVANIDLPTAITGFMPGNDVIDDESLKLNSGTTYTVTGTGAVQTVTITSGGNSLTFETQNANLSTGTFNLTDGGPLNLTASGSGGVEVTICFLEGTLIATPTGEKPVESFRSGDEILLADGSTDIVRWVGYTTVCTAFADPLHSMPIRIQAGALGHNLPRRDLLVSPGHAVLIDGVLVHAAALVNGASITRETNMPRTFKYFHIELDRHALLLSEGVASESFIDHAGRMSFDNWAERGDAPEIEEMDYPRAKSARQVPTRIRDFIAGRAYVLEDAA